MIKTAIADHSSAPEATPPGADRRAHARLRAEDLATLGAKLASGTEIRLIDLSRGGAQFECDRRFLPNATLSLRLVTPDATFVVSSRVVRSRIVRLSTGGLGYNVAVAFNELLQNLLEEPVTTAAPAASPPVVDSTSDCDAASIDATSDISTEEAAAFEATAPTAPAGCTLTASVEQTGEELRDLFNGNNW